MFLSYVRHKSITYIKTKEQLLLNAMYVHFDKNIALLKICSDLISFLKCGFRYHQPRYKYCTQP